MGKIIKARKIGNSIIFGIPKSIAAMHNIKQGTEIEIEAYTSDQLIFRIKK